MTTQAKQETRKWRLVWPLARQQHVVVPVDTTTPILPKGCANCGDDAGRTKKEETRGRSLMVPYCVRCFRLASREDTRRFAAALSSVMLAVTLLLTLPRLWAAAGFWWYALLALVGTCLPIVVVLIVQPRPAGDQTSSGRAVWWDRELSVVCTSPSWAQALAQGNEREVQLRTAVRSQPWALFSGALLVVLAAPVLYAFQHPEVVVLNLGTESFAMLVDGTPLARVEVTSLESSASGQRLRLTAGRHRVSLVAADGSVLHEEDVAVRAGHVHLYAPLSVEHCFWLERDTYGRVKEEGARFRPLPEGRRFWALPVDVDNWFAANPLASTDERSSGGTMTALRHAPCEQAPPEVR